MSILKAACELTLRERAVACVFIVEGNDGIRYVNGVTGSDMDPGDLVDVTGAAS